MGTRSCDVAGCPARAQTDGLCGRHLGRRRRRGDPRAVTARREADPGTPACSVDGCLGAVQARGWCSAHYQRWRRTGRVDEHAPVRAWGLEPELRICRVAGCPDLVDRRDLCCSHYGRWKTYGDPLAGGAARAPDGSGTTDRNGYRVVTVDGVKVFEHRVVMQRLLGRPLERDENVHHRNGDPRTTVPRTWSCGAHPSRRGSAWSTRSTGLGSCSIATQQVNPSDAGRRRSSGKDGSLTRTRRTRLRWAILGSNQ